MEGDLVAKSPADSGLPPSVLGELIGHVLLRALSEDEAVLAQDLSDPAISDAPPVGIGSVRAADL